MSVTKIATWLGIVSAGIGIIASLWGAIFFLNNWHASKVYVLDAQLELKTEQKVAEGDRAAEMASFYNSKGLIEPLDPVEEQYRDYWSDRAQSLRSEVSQLEAERRELKQ